MITKPQVASILRFIADIFHSGDEAEQPEIPAVPIKRRGRPPGNSNPAPAETPTNPAPAEPEPVKPAESALKVGKTIEQLRELIQPLIKATRGTEVKAVLNKFAPAGHDGDYTLSALSERPEVHADFVSQIEGLLM